MHCLGHQQKLFATSSHFDIHRHPDLHHGPSQHLHVQHRLLPRGGLQGLLRRSRQLQSHMPASAVHCPQLHVGISGRGRLSKNAYYDQEPFALRHGLSLHPANWIIAQTFVLVFWYQCGQCWNALGHDLSHRGGPLCGGCGLTRPPSRMDDAIGLFMAITGERRETRDGSAAIFQQKHFI